MVRAVPIRAGTAAGGPRAGGRRIVVRGRGFFDVVAVGFGNVDGRDVRVLNPRALLVTVPARSAATVRVTVRSGWGASRTTAATTYTYSPPPGVATVTPSSGLRRRGGTVEITGSGFTGTSRVRFGTVASRSVQVVSSGQLRAVVPAHAAGTVHVFVTTGAGTSRFTPANRYTYVAAGSPR